MKNLFSSKNIRNNWLYVLITKPNLYVFRLLNHLVIVGIFTFVISYLYFNSSYKEIKIPTVIHAIISVAIGLLLVFRTQTAYERWSTASKNLYELQAHFEVLFFRIKSLNSDLKIELKNNINDFCYNFGLFLKEDKNKIKLCNNFEKKYKDSLLNIFKIIDSAHKNNNIDKSDINFIMRSLSDILITCSGLSRIKNTPIPMSYEIHIKVCIFFYICSLPFGILYDMGIWSALVVVLVYYIMAGIEIISKEIENPFYGDPNDLPVDSFMKKIKDNFI